MSPGTASLLLPVSALLLVAASRLLRLDDHVMNPDEVWSIWQTLGSFGDILRWTPRDWPPLYYLTLGAWSQVVGIKPLALRALSALVFLPGAAFAFRIGRRRHGSQGGMLAMLVWSALGLVIQLSVEVRGYALMLPLTMLAIWLTLRYFGRPDWRRALPLALSMAAMFYVSYTGGMVIALLVLFSLLVWRRRSWRWWLPGSLTLLLILPELLDLAAFLGQRAPATGGIAALPVARALAQLYVDYAGAYWPLWALLGAIALYALLRHERGQDAMALALSVWALGMPALVYLFNNVLGLFHGRYTWWILPGIALWLARGLAWLPRRGIRLATLLLLPALFAPLPADSPYQIFDVLSPLEANFRWLREHMQWGDVVLSSARHRCGHAEEWDYHQRAWLPNGLRVVTDPVAHRRVWVLNPEWQAPWIQAHLAEARVPGHFVGPWGCLLRLHEAAPEPQGTAYANGMRFHGAELMRGTRSLDADAVFHEGETLQLRLWWSVDTSPQRDYSLHTWLSREDVVLAEVNGPPQPWWPPDAPDTTSRWQPGRRYVERRELDLPLPAETGRYDVFMKLYYWEDLESVGAPGLGPHGERLVASLQVRSY